MVGPPFDEESHGYGGPTDWEAHVDLIRLPF